MTLKTHIVNPLAKKLNDSAMQKWMNLSDSSDYGIVIGLLDQATTIDSQFYIAYWNKLALLNTIGKYNEAIHVTRDLLRLQPNTADVYTIIGTMYEKMGKPDSAKIAYNMAEEKFSNILDTMSKKTKVHKDVMLNRAINLKMMGQEQQENALLKQMYDKETDSTWKELILSFMNKPKEELFDTNNGVKEVIARPNQ